MWAACSMERSGRNVELGRDAQIEVLAEPVPHEAARALERLASEAAHCSSGPSTET